MADWFEAGLLDLGHRVTFSDRRVERNAINLFWECFTPKSSAWLASLPVHYGIIATEIPDGNAFNWRTEPAWQERFNAFARAAKRASFIWTMVEDTVPFYSQFCPAAYMEMGFSERLIPDYIDQVPEIDFCFFGQHTPYRDNAVEKLRRYTNVEWPAFLPGREIGQLIARCRVGLSFKQSDEWPIPSPTRLGRLIMAKRGVASEYVPIATRQGDIAGLCPKDVDFIDYAMAMLLDWRTRAEAAFEQYRAKMPMRDIMEQVLDRTIQEPNKPALLLARVSSFLRWQIRGRTACP